MYSWLSTVGETVVDSDGEETIVEREPIITKSTEISTLAKIIDDRDALQELEQKRNITDAYSASSFVGDDKYTKAITNIEQNIQDASSFAKYATNFNKDKLVELKNKLDGILVSQGHKDDVVITKGVAKRILINYKTQQFDSITLRQFKGFSSGLNIREFNRINIIAGDNNVGKSSLLEAIYLLANQNDINSVIELYRRRGKFTESLPVNWLVKEFNGFDLEASFDGKSVFTKGLKRVEEDSNIEKSDYLASLIVTSSFNGEKALSSTARLFQRKSTEQYYEEIRSICSASFSSPFTMLSKDLINEYHELSVQKGTYESIIGFIKEYVDKKIAHITKVGESDQIRFLVKHEDFYEPVDLTQFGEGLQRIFFISLQLAAAENGVMCIDEIENAIHHSLLVQFTKFIQVLAEEYNVQLFVTTHSSECIRAFFENNYRNEEITGYRLYATDQGVHYKAARGANLQSQISNFDLDLRG